MVLKQFVYCAACDWEGVVDDDLDECPRCQSDQVRDGGVAIV